MTPEEIQRTMEFIIEHQAQFAANIQRMEENIQRLEEERIRDRPRLARLEESFQVLVQLAQITENRDRLESTSSALESNMAALAEAQTHTDERLSALIDIVREQRNGRSS